MQVGKEILVDWPNEIFITIIAGNSDTAAGNFKINYSLIDRVPADVLATMTEDEKREYFDKKVIVEQEAYYSNERFWAIVGLSFIGLLCLISAVVLFCKMRKANITIVSDVQVLKKEDDNVVEKLPPTRVLDPEDLDGRVDIPASSNQSGAPSKPYVDEDTTKVQFKKAIKASTNKVSAEPVRDANKTLTPKKTPVSHSPGFEQGDDAFENERVLAMKELLRRDNLPG